MITYTKVSVIKIKSKITIKRTLYSLPYAFCLFLIFNFIFLIEANATIRYVSHTGTSTPPYTSWATAAHSIQKAIDICVDGDTIIVANGVYYENLVIDSALTLIGSSMDSTVIDGRVMGDFTISVYADLIINNFHIYGKGNGIGDAAIRNFQAINILNVKNCKIQEARIGIGWVSALTSSTFEVENLFISDLTRGFSISGQGNNFISNCVIVLDNENARGISIGFAPSGDYYITNNIILFTGSSFNNLERGIYVDRPRKVFVNNNIISRIGAGVDIDINIDSAIISNNLFNYIPLGIGSLNDDALIENNILKNNSFAGIFGWPVQSDYNLFWENNVDYTYNNYGDSDVVADPMFVKDTIPTIGGNYDFHLQAYSPGIDKGNPDILDIDGSRSDIGLYGGSFGQSYKYIDLPPKPPVNLSASVDTNEIFLKWNRNTEADTSHYNVYRDTVVNFTIDSTKLVSSKTDTFFIQYPPYESSQYVYKITCVDNQGNESMPSEEIVVKTTSVNEYPFTVNDYLLFQNYPNPFNPSTKIGYKLKERGYVKMMVYDIKGELVSVLVNKEQYAGYYEVTFDAGYLMLDTGNKSADNGLASGIYLYRIEVIGEGNIPVYSDMKKMILIK